jgi:hypothetical protein
MRFKSILQLRSAAPVAGKVRQCNGTVFAAHHLEYTQAREVVNFDSPVNKKSEIT